MQSKHSREEDEWLLRWPSRSHFQSESQPAKRSEERSNRVQERDGGKEARETQAMTSKKSNEWLQQWPSRSHSESESQRTKGKTRRERRWKREGYEKHKQRQERKCFRFELAVGLLVRQSGLNGVASSFCF